jgi:hypothetical protein
LRVGQETGDRLGALRRADGPRKRQQVAIVAFRGEQRGQFRRVVRPKSSFEPPEPSVGRGERLGGGCCQNCGGDVVHRRDLREGCMSRMRVMRL